MTNAVDIDFIKGCANYLKLIEDCLINNIIPREAINDQFRFLYLNALKVECISGRFIKYNLCISFKKNLGEIQSILGSY